MLQHHLLHNMSTDTQGLHHMYALSAIIPWQEEKNYAAYKPYANGIFA